MRTLPLQISTGRSKHMGCFTRNNGARTELTFLFACHIVRERSIGYFHDNFSLLNSLRTRFVPVRVFSIEQSLSQEPYDEIRFKFSSKFVSVIVLIGLGFVPVVQPR